MHLVLVHPEIPHNTGCAARLAAALGLPLHLVEPLGFSLEDIGRHLRLYDRVPVTTGELKLKLASVDGAIELLDAKLADLQAAIADLRRIRAKCVTGLRRGR